MYGSPMVVTNPYQHVYTSAPLNDNTNRILAAKQVVQQIPVFQPSYQFSVPPRQFTNGQFETFNKSGVARDVPTTPGAPNLTYVYPVQAPPVKYVNKSYKGLVTQAASPIQVDNRPKTQLTAPSILTTYTY